MAVSAQFILIDFIREMSDHNKNFTLKLIEFRLFFPILSFYAEEKLELKKKTKNLKQNIPTINVAQSSFW